MLKFDKSTYLLFLSTFILSKRLSSILWGSKNLLFPKLTKIVPILFYNKLTKIVPILFYNFIKFFILSYTVLVASLARCKKYLI